MGKNEIFIQLIIWIMEQPSHNIHVDLTSVQSTKYERDVQWDDFIRYFLIQKYQQVWLTKDKLYNFSIII